MNSPSGDPVFLRARSSPVHGYTKLFFRVDGEEVTVAVPSALLATLDLGQGQALTEEEWRMVKEAEGCLLAYRRAVCALCSTDQSAAALYRKLRAKGFSAEAARFAVDRVEGEGLLNEERQIDHATAHLFGSRRYGPRRLTAYLISKGYRPEDVRRRVRQYFEDNRINPEEAFRALCREKGVRGEEAEALRRRYGY